VIDAKSPTRLHREHTARDVIDTVKSFTFRRLRVTGLMNGETKTLTVSGKGAMMVPFARSGGIEAAWRHAGSIHGSAAQVAHRIMVANGTHLAPDRWEPSSLIRRPALHGD
jgi:hypothetical protein